jgi:hypothetical protein
MPLRKDNDEERSQRIEEALARAVIRIRRHEASQDELDARRPATEPIGRQHAGSDRLDMAGDNQSDSKKKRSNGQSRRTRSGRS